VPLVVGAVEIAINSARATFASDLGYGSTPIAGVRNNLLAAHGSVRGKLGVLPVFLELDRVLGFFALGDDGAAVRQPGLSFRFLKVEADGAHLECVVV
jgi:hypothetical protein